MARTPRRPLARPVYDPLFSFSFFFFNPAPAFELLYVPALGAHNVTKADDVRCRKRMRPQARRQRRMPSEQLKRTSNGRREPRGVTPRSKPVATIHLLRTQPLTKRLHKIEKKPKPRRPRQPARRPNATLNSPPKKHPSPPRAARVTSKQPPRSPAA